jgi:hypothetical protein
MPPRGQRLTKAEFDALVDQLREQGQFPPQARLPKHLTEAEFAEREGVEPPTAAEWRKNGTGPPYLPLSKSATKGTIRYRLADIEAWEAERLVVPVSA